MGKVKESEVMFHKDRFEEKYIDELLKYQEAYNILMDYFDEWDSETKFLVHRKLEKIGL